MIDKLPIPRRLRAVRLAAELSQEKLGVLAGIDEFSASARMSQYETGKHVPDFITMKKIAKVLDVPTSFFYTEEDEIAELMLSRSKKLKNEL